MLVSFYGKGFSLTSYACGVRKQGDAADIYRQLESIAKTGRLAEQLASVLRNLLPLKQ
jgi:hypothetical protein